MVWCGGVVVCSGVMWCGGVWCGVVVCSVVVCSGVVVWCSGVMFVWCFCLRGYDSDSGYVAFVK